MIQSGATSRAGYQRHCQVSQCSGRAITGKIDTVLLPLCWLEQPSQKQDVSFMVTPDSGIDDIAINTGEL